MAPPGAMWPTLPNRTAPVEFMGRSKKGRRRAFPEMAIWRERETEREREPFPYCESGSSKCWFLGQRSCRQPGLVSLHSVKLPKGFEWILLAPSGSEKGCQMYIRWFESPDLPDKPAVSSMLGNVKLGLITTPRKVGT